MTHPKNYEYQKRWREENRNKYLEAKRGYTLKSYYYKQAIKELIRSHRYFIKTFYFKKIIYY